MERATTHGIFCLFTWRSRASEQFASLSIVTRRLLIGILQSRQKKLPPSDAYIDGEVLVLDEAGVSSFASLQDALSLKKRTERLVYFAFDLLHLDGHDIQSLPLVERKRKLEALLGKLKKSGPVRYSQHVVGQGPAFFKQACKLQLEGIVSKLASSVYRSGRDTAWLKVKCRLRQEFVGGGWRQSDVVGRTLSSLLFGYYDTGKLAFAGKLGTGFPQDVERDLLARLAKLGQSRSHRLQRSQANTSRVPSGFGPSWWSKVSSRLGLRITCCVKQPTRACGRTSRRGR